tara:strand:+ start:213 stop:347 length:135 start_codon:yes stop_codon:yes gene_type:complete
MKNKKKKTTLGAQVTEEEYDLAVKNYGTPSKAVQSFVRGLKDLI